MRFVTTIDESLRKELLKVVESRPYRHVTDDCDAYFQRADQFGPYFGRVVKLKMKGFLHPHTDDCTHTHVVLQTNEFATCYVNNKAYWLKQGGVYEFDARLEHYATNYGDTDRIHLIL